MGNSCGWGTNSNRFGVEPELRVTTSLSIEKSTEIIAGRKPRILTLFEVCDCLCL